MKRLVLNSALSLRISEKQRMAIEQIADAREIAMGEVCRELIDIGLRVKATG